MSISSARVRVIDCPATAIGRSPLAVTMRVMRLSRPEGWARIASPGLTMPLEIVPEKPRKSRSGRLTHCTGMRNTSFCCRVSSSSTDSRKAISVGPWYQGVLSLGTSMLSPRSAESGIAVMSSRPTSFANSRYLPSMSRKTSSE